MTGLAYEHLIDYPSAVFKGWNTSKFSNDFLDVIQDARAASRPLPQLLKSRMRWYPDLAAIHYLKGNITKEELSEIVAPPLVRFRALVSDYQNLHEVLEEGLYTDPETVERLVRWTRVKGITLARPVHEYMHLLAGDPNRLHRLTPIEKRPPRDQVAALATANRDKSPGWAFLYLCLHNIPQIPDEMLSLLRSNDEYAYLSAYILQRRGYESDVWVNLLENIQSPRWACQVLVDLDSVENLPEDLKRRLSTLVHSSPPWACTFWQKRLWPISAIEWGFEEVLALAPNHECLPELRSWCAMEFAKQGKAFRHIVYAA